MTDRSLGVAPLSEAERRAFEWNLPKYYLLVFLQESQFWFPIWVAFLLIERDLSLTEIAIMEAPFWVLVVLAEVPTGAVADRWGRSFSLSLGAFTYAGALVAFGLAPTWPWIMVSYMVWAVALTFTSGADSALVYDTLKSLGREPEYEKHAGRAVAISSVAVVLATLGGGPIADATSLQAPIFMGAGFLLVAGVVAAWFHEPPRLESGPQVAYWTGVGAATRTVWRTPTVRAVIPFGAITMAATVATIYLIQPFLLSHDVEVGWAFSGLQVPSQATAVVGAIGAAWFLSRLGELRALLALPLLVGVAYTGLAVWDHLGAVAFLAAAGLVRAAAVPIVTGYINRRVPSDQRATVLSLNQLAFSLVLAPIVPAVGISADKLDLPTAFAVGAAILAAFGLLLGVLWARAHMREQAPSLAAALAVAGAGGAAATEAASVDMAPLE